MCFSKSRFLFLLFLFLGCRVNNTEKYLYKLPIIPDSRNMELEMKRLEKRLSQDPQNPVYKVELAEAFFLSGKKTGSEKDFEKALVLLKNSSHPDSPLIMAKIKETRHEFADAIDLAQNFLKQNPNSRQALSITATSHLALGNLNEAIQAADRLVELFPRTSTLSLRGLVLLTMGREEEGIFELERALAIEDIGEVNESSWARSILARHFIIRNKFSEAEFLLNEVLKMSPGYSFALDLKAQLSAQTEKLKDAETLFEKAFRESKELAQLRHHAELNAQSGKWQLAIDRWSQVEKLVKSDLAKGRTDHRLELVKVFLRRKENNDVKESLRLLEEELKTRKTAEVFYLFSLAYSETGDWKLAARSMKSVFALHGTHPQYYLHSSFIQKKMENELKAGLYENLAKKLDPDVSQRLTFL